MRHFLLSLGLVFGLHQIAQSQAVISTLSIDPVNPNNCSSTIAEIDLVLYCANYTYTGASVNVSGSNISINLTYTVGLICLPAFQYPTVTVNLGQLSPGSVSITAHAFLNGNLSSSSSTINTFVSSCCGAVAEFTPSEDTICLGESITVNNTTTGADSVKWYQDWTLVDTNWSPTLTFDSAGLIELSCVAFADTCTDTTEHFIKVYGLPNLNLGPDTTLCAGQSLTLTVPGGLSNYNWSTGGTSNSIIVTGVGTYWVSAVNNQGCTGYDTMSVTGILPISAVDLGNDKLICPDESTTLSATGSFANYLWSTGATTATISVNNIGLYWLEATAQGECPGRDTIEVFDYQVNPIVVNESENKCGENTLSTASAYSQYQWSTGSTSNQVTVTDSTFIFVTVTDVNGCSQSDSLLAEVWPNPVVDLGEDTYYCPGEELFFESNITGTYNWSTGSTSVLIAVTSAGTYWLEVTDDNGCTGRDTVVVDYCLGLAEGGTSSFVTFPVPANDFVYVTLPMSGAFDGQMFDMRGRLVLETRTQGSQLKIDVSALPAGSYVLSIKGSGMHFERQLIVIQ
jgi:hypothetical protein